MLIGDGTRSASAARTASEVADVYHRKRLTGRGLVRCIHPSRALWRARTFSRSGCVGSDPPEAARPPPGRDPPEGGPGPPLGGPLGAPRGGSRGCTFSRVFNNSPSRDRCWCLRSTRSHRESARRRGPPRDPPGPPGGSPRDPPPRGTPPGGVPGPPMDPPVGVCPTMPSMSRGLSRGLASYPQHLATLCGARAQPNGRTAAKRERVTLTRLGEGL